MAKNKQPPRTFTRNPFVAAVRDPKGLFREKTAKSDDERKDQRDAWSRNGKHKKNKNFNLDEGADIDESFQIGDEVRYKGKEGIVTNANPVLGMIGITVDGKYGLAHEDHLELIEESFARLAYLAEFRSYDTDFVRMNPSVEEQNILDKVADGPVLKSDLDEREAEVARLMTTKGYLNRSRNTDNKVIYTANKTKLRRN